MKYRIIRNTRAREFVRNKMGDTFAWIKKGQIVYSNNGGAFDVNIFGRMIIYKLISFDKSCSFEFFVKERDLVKI